MHDLRLVGVHEDGEHLLLSDAEGGRFSLPVDEALRAAVRRDRAHLGQLQIEIEGGLRPRDVQSRIRAGASAIEVAALAGWTVEKVRRYEGPVLAERAHVAELARTVRVRQRGADPTPLGVLVARRLAGRGVDPDRVGWDAWRPDSAPWTVAAIFPAGGRERQARWHFDVGAMSVVAADDEARWLSDDDDGADGGALSPARLSAVREGQTGFATGVAAVYDIEADGGVSAEPRRVPGGDPLDLVGAMRSRRRSGSGSARRHAPAPAAAVASTGDRPSDIPGSTHPAGRRRGQPEPLELDPTLMDDPPAAHPRASESEPPATGERSTPKRWPLADPMRAAAGPADESTPGPVDESTPGPAAGPADGAAMSPVSAPRVDPVGDRPDESPDDGAAPRATAASRRGRRSSVPSWDDIVFGAKKD